VRIANMFVIRTQPPVTSIGNFSGHLASFVKKSNDRAAWRTCT
jgi:hypothetical protein